MAQNPTQRTTGSTRLRGPLVVTNRGAGSKGHDYKWGGVAPVGGGLDVALSLQVPSGQVAPMLQFEQPDSGNATGSAPTAPGAATVLGGIDAGMGLCLTPMTAAGVFPTSRRVIQVALTAANIIAMYTTPVPILAAPAAGVGYMVDQVAFEVKATATAFTSGGVVGVQYAATAHGAGTIVHAGTLPASVVNAGAGSTLTAFWPASGSNGVTVPNDGTSASGLYISNATGVFASGTGTMIVTVWYTVVTLG